MYGNKVLGRNERGAAGLKAVISFAILGALVYIGVQIIPIYAAHWKFEDDLKNNILFASERYRGAEGGIEKGLTKDIYDMLDNIRAKYDKKKGVIVDVKTTSDQKNISVDVWYEKPTNLPFVPKLQFHTSLHNTPLKGL